jgi:hypothetical protein
MRPEHRTAWWVVAVVGVSLACAGAPTPDVPSGLPRPTGGLGGFGPTPPPLRAPVPAEVVASRTEFERAVTAAVVELRVRQKAVTAARQEVDRLTAQVEAHPEHGELLEQLAVAQQKLVDADTDAPARPVTPSLVVPYPGLACDRDSQCRALRVTPCDPEPIGANQAFEAEMTQHLRAAVVLASDCAAVPPPVEVACAAGYCAVPGMAHGDRPARRAEADGDGFEYVDTELRALDERWGGEVVGPPPFDYDALMKDRQAELDGMIEVLRQDLEQNPTPEKQEAMRQIEALVEQGKAYRPR